MLSASVKISFKYVHAKFSNNIMPMPALCLLILNPSGNVLHCTTSPLSRAQLTKPLDSVAKESLMFKKNIKKTLDSVKKDNQNKV